MLAVRSFVSDIRLLSSALKALRISKYQVIKYKVLRIKYNKEIDFFFLNEIYINVIWKSSIYIYISRATD